MTCPFCNATGNTNVETIGCASGNWLVCLIVGVLLGLGPFGFIAFCIDDLKDHKHTCRSCNKHLATQSLFGG